MRATSTICAGAVITVGASFLPGLEQAWRAVQDANDALLGAKVLPASQGALSHAMQRHQVAAKGILRFLKLGGGR